MVRSEEIRSRIKESLDEEEAAREKAYGLSRKLVKYCREAISSMVKGEKVDIQYITDLSGKVERMSWKWTFGFVEDSKTEYAEAILLYSIVNDLELPSPEGTGLSERAYALGACDAVGELRRIALERNISGDMEGALDYLEKMREVFSIVDGLTYPSGMIQLKRKQDSARAQIDRTLGDLTFAKSARMIGIEGGDKGGRRKE